MIKQSKSFTKTLMSQTHMQVCIYKIGLPGDKLDVIFNNIGYFSKNIYSSKLILITVVFFSDYLQQLFTVVFLQSLVDETIVQII